MSEENSENNGPDWGIKSAHWRKITAGWHPLALGWFQSLEFSPGFEDLTANDKFTAAYWATKLSQDLYSPEPIASLTRVVRDGMNDFLASPSARKKLAVEAAKIETEAMTQSEIQDYFKTVISGGK